MLLLALGIACAPSVYAQTTLLKLTIGERPSRSGGSLVGQKTTADSPNSCEELRVVLAAGNLHQ